MKYAVDRIEGSIVVLENLEDTTIVKININDIDFKVKEKDILINTNNKYIKDDNEKENRIKIIQDKLNRVKNIKKI